MDLSVLPKHDRGVGKNRCAEVEAQRRDIVCERDEFELSPGMGNAYEDRASPGGVEEGREGRVFGRLGRGIGRDGFGENLLVGVGWVDLGRWEEGGEVRRN